MTDKEQKAAAKKFAENWKGKGDEKQDTQKFWLSLLRDVFGIDEPEMYIDFEKPVKLDHTSFIDGYIRQTNVMIEQKSIDVGLRSGLKQSDGSVLTPYQQARRYNGFLPKSEQARWIIVSNFANFEIHDMEKPNDPPQIITLEDFPKNYHCLNILIDTSKEEIKQEMEISLQAGELVGKLRNAIEKQYINPKDPGSLRSLNMLCVRLVFCLYAEDSQIFAKRLMFHDYMKRFGARDSRRALTELFYVLDTKEEDRDPYLDDELKAFPYVNGGLFADKNIEIPNFNDEILDILLRKASEDFDWSKISPAIFGAAFESTLNPETRRNGGMHYTSLENIHKVIDPLFLDDLRRELEEIKAYKQPKTVSEKVAAFQKKLASLKFLDPACGSGNFLTETYISLRKLENEAISLTQAGGQSQFDLMGDVIKVSISQFYGIEINDFAVAVAKTALWIAESQMKAETEGIIHMDLQYLPLQTIANIVEGNSLRIDWESVVPKSELNYIMGNPPFVGARIMDKPQKDDIISVFGNIKNIGNLDYVTAWYKKAADLMTDTNIRTAFVSTNSVSQGEQVAILWKPLFDNGVHIDFAYRTFRWDNRGENKEGKRVKTDKKMAAVHCVIIGFSIAENNSKILFESGRGKTVSNINGYLIEANNVFIESRSKPICNVPEIGIGNMPLDGGNYLFTEEEKDEFVASEPSAKEWFMPWIGSHEFINRYFRYCLYLEKCPPNVLRKMPNSLKRVQNVRDFRANSDRKPTQRLAETPQVFATVNIPDTNYIVVPKVSSERRKYIPIDLVNIP